MTEDRRKQILEMIAKLSRITRESNAFQGEIENAASKIQELMDKYSITQDMVDEVNASSNSRELEREFESKSADYCVRGIVRWHWDLAGVIARITHTRHYCRSYKRTGTFVFFGEQANVEVATALFIEWVQVIEMMAVSALDDRWKYLMKKYDYNGWLMEKKERGYADEKFMDSVPFEERTTYFKSSWLQGCVDGIRCAVSKQEELREEKVGTAIVLYQDKVDEAYAIMAKEQKFSRVSVSSPKLYSSQGYEGGYKVGKGITLNSKKIGG